MAAVMENLSGMETLDQVVEPEDEFAVQVDTALEQDVEEDGEVEVRQ